jgi:hypothetical protein
MPKTSQVIRQIRAANVVAGIRKHMPPGRKVYLDGKAYTSKELIALFQEQVDAIDAVRSARAALTAAVRKERVVAKKVNAATLGLQSIVRPMFALGSAALADFGWAPPKKPGPKTTAAKLAGVLKAAATRKARRTMGRRQRLKIRGELPPPSGS